MDESTDVDRMLARLGENNIQYREFAHTVVSPTGPWDPNDKSRPQVDVSAPPVAPAGSWNTGHLPAAPLRTEPLLIDPEAPGGRLAAIPQAQQSGIPTPDSIADGRTPPAPVDRTSPPLDHALSPPVVAPAPQAPAVRQPGTLDGLFHRVSGNEQPAAAGAKPAPLSALFKRLS